jgi:Trypsin-like peptidase domain
LALLFGNPAIRAVNFPIELKQVVVFLYRPSVATNGVPDGTGFLVTIPRLGATNQSYPYLVTAKHVIETKTGAGTFIPKISVRLNRRDGSPAEKFAIPLMGDDAHQNVFVHKDETVDVAVIPFAPSETTYDCKALDVDYLLSQEDVKKLNVHEGTDLCFIGMFVHHTGTMRNTPILRFGKVALMPEERIDWISGKTDLYLVEASCFGGNSGSPMFFLIGDERNPGILTFQTLPRLGGVVIGHYNDILEVKAVTTGTTNNVVLPNLGISAAVPAYKVREILFSDEVSHRRR